MDKNNQHQSFKEKYLNQKVILIIVLIIVIIGAGGAIFVTKASDNPTFCKTCHNMEPYYKSFAEEGFLANKHADADLNCHSCHESSLVAQGKELVLYVSGNFEDPMGKREFPQEFCIECHNYDEVKSKTQFETSNPHDSHNGQQECYICHSMHREQELMCGKCHTYDWMDDLDDNWNIHPPQF
jgi:cytochrome c nitrite reductase small subunit